MNIDALHKPKLRGFRLISDKGDKMPISKLQLFFPHFQNLAQQLFASPLRPFIIGRQNFGDLDQAIHARLWPAFDYDKLLTEKIMNALRENSLEQIHVVDYIGQNYSILLTESIDMEADDKNYLCSLFAGEDQNPDFSLDCLYNDSWLPAFILGPYLLPQPEISLEQLIHNLQLNQSSRETLRVHLTRIPIINNISSANILLTELAGAISGKKKTVSFQSLYLDQSDFHLKQASKNEDSEDMQKNIEIIENRYRLENQITSAVLRGDFLEATQNYHMISKVNLLRKYRSTSERNLVDLTIMNTILRKSIETLNVHPYYIDAISGHFAALIAEEATKPPESLALRMIKAYSDLARQSLLQSYSFHVQRIILYVKTNLHEKLSLSDLAEFTKLNPSYLSAHFVAETGQTLTQYIQMTKIKHAMELLQNSETSVAEIGAAVGMNDLSHFSKTFKKIVGSSPIEYRKSKRR